MKDTRSTYARLAPLALALALATAHGAAIHAGEPQVISENEMLCSTLDALTSTTVEAATPSGGGIALVRAGTDYLTTERCIANLGHTVTPKPLRRTPLHCNDATGAPIYIGIATRLALTEGVWTWTEEGTGDAYIATLECIATEAE